MYAKPDSIPPVTSFLKSEDIKTGVLEFALFAYLSACEMPDHYEDPYEYIEAVSYIETIQAFVEILKHERTKSPKSTSRTA